MFKRLVATLISFTFISSSIQAPIYAFGNATEGTGNIAQDFSINQLPLPGKMVDVSEPYIPLVLKGLVVNLKKPLEFQFIVDTGNSLSQQEQLKAESTKLIKYFLAGLTIPEGELWVNLSPYEKNRIVPSALGQTELGRDLLAQDYILKQLSSSLIYPEKDLGKEFWSRVYKKAQEQFGTTDIPINTFNKVWILPDQAQVFEHEAAAYVTKATLKVMLDEDYLALQKHISTVCHDKQLTTSKQLGLLGANIIRAIILPEITKEVNTGKNFAPLRQIYDALILAKWYKQTIQNSLLDAIYTNKNKIAGVNLNDPAVKERIYQRYLQAYKKGVFNYIKEDIVPRKYFSGGERMIIPLITDGAMPAVHADGAMLKVDVKLTDAAMIIPASLITAAGTHGFKVSGGQINYEYLIAGLALIGALIFVRALYLYKTNSTAEVLPTAIPSIPNLLDPVVRNNYLSFLAKEGMFTDQEAKWLNRVKELTFKSYNFIEGPRAIEDFIKKETEIRGPEKRHILDSSGNTVNFQDLRVSNISSLHFLLFNDKYSTWIIILKNSGDRRESEKTPRGLVNAAMKSEPVTHTPKSEIPISSPLVVSFTEEEAKKTIFAGLKSKNSIIRIISARVIHDNRKEGWSPEDLLEAQKVFKDPPSLRTPDNVNFFARDVFSNDDPVFANMRAEYLRQFKRRSIGRFYFDKDIIINHSELFGGDGIKAAAISQLSADFKGNGLRAAISVYRVKDQELVKNQKEAATYEIKDWLAGLLSNNTRGPHDISLVFDNIDIILENWKDWEIPFDQKTWTRMLFPRLLLYQGKETGQVYRTKAAAAVYKYPEFFEPDFLANISFPLKVRQKEVSKAMKADNNSVRPSRHLGGIDLNQIIFRREGRKINVQFDPAQLSELIRDGFEGFSPVVTAVEYIGSPFPLMGVSAVKELAKA